MEEKKSKEELEKELQKLMEEDPKVSKALRIKDKLDEIAKEARELDETRIEKLGFTDSTIQALRRCNLTTLRRLKNTTIEHMRSIGLEKTTIKEVRKVLGNLGVQIVYMDKPNYPNSEECREALLKAM